MEAKYSEILKLTSVFLCLALSNNVSPHLASCQCLHANTNSMLYQKTHFYDTEECPNKNYFYCLTEIYELVFNLSYCY